VLIFSVQRRALPGDFPSHKRCAADRPCTAVTPHKQERLEVTPTLRPDAPQELDRSVCGAKPGSSDVGQLAHYPAIFRGNRLYRERRADKDQEWRLAGGSGLDQGPRRQDSDQC
jgi:hypothetical protein